MAFSSIGVQVTFSTIGFRGNTVTLYEPQMQHILEHPEMAGLQQYIEAAVVNPDKVCESNKYPDSFGFEYSDPNVVQILGAAGSTATEIRVWVHSPDPGIFVLGGGVGFVSTAHPIDYPLNPKVGRVIFKK